MTISPVMHSSARGTTLSAIISLSSLKSLSAEQVNALRTIGINRLSDLLHYKPIHDSRLLMAIARGQIAHDVDFSDLLDTRASGALPKDLPGLRAVDLKSVTPAIAQVLLDRFHVKSLPELAEFAAFDEAQRFLAVSGDIFREPASAPDELMPKPIGHVQSTAVYSSFVRESLLRLRHLELVYDEARQHFVDVRLAALFPVRGIGAMSLSPLSTAGSLPSLGLATGGQGAAFKALIPAVPELHLGYVARFTQKWVNLGTPPWRDRSQPRASTGREPQYRGDRLEEISAHAPERGHACL